MAEKNTSTICVVLITIGFIAAFYINSLSYSGIENYTNYQCEINKLERDNNLAKDKYPFQDVSQVDVNAQQRDYARTYAVPQELADNYERIFPDDLLPQEKESTEWSRVNPEGKGSLQLKNMLAAGTHIGVNTQGSSLKNANLQLRSEPPAPIIPVSIFLNSSITPDIYRKQFEIGS